jgi:cell division protein FtsL
MPATAARKKHRPDSLRTSPKERVAENATNAPYTASSSTRRSRVVTGTVSARHSLPRGGAQQAPLPRDQRDTADAATLPDGMVMERRLNPRLSPDEYAGSYSETIDEARPRSAYVRRTRRALRRAHRPFRLSMTAGVASSLVLLQLVALLWLKGVALSARNRADVLDRKITEISGEIAKTEDAVAKLSSPPQLKQWAEELGMRPVTQADIDDIRQRTPWSPTSSPDGSAPANAAGTDTSNARAPGNTDGTARQKEDER